MFDDARARLHHASACLRCPIRAEQIHVQHGTEILGSLARRGCGMGDAGVVDQDVEPTELGDRGPGEGVALLGVGDVGGDDEAASAGGLDRGADGVELLATACGDHHVRPGLREGAGEPCSEAAAGARDDGDGPVEPEEVEDRAGVVCGICRGHVAAPGAACHEVRLRALRPLKLIT